jgi:uncharacterized OsmC-like protein
LYHVGLPEQSVVETRRHTETGEAPGSQGATTEKIGQHSREEPRREPGCRGRRMQPGFNHGLPAFTRGFADREGLTMAETIVNNGVNVDALLAAREALKATPEAAKFTWRATCRWKNGTHSCTKVQEFYGLGQEQKHRTEFSFEADHPEIFASEDLGATPVEYVLVGLSSCLIAGVAAVAQNRGIQLRSIEAKLEGSMDVQGILGIDSDVRNGYDAIKVTFHIDADASKKDIEALVAQSQKRSAVYDIVTNPTNVIVEVA